MFRGSSLATLKRIGCGIVGVMVLAVGLYFSRAAHGFSYRNWFGGLVFGPVAVLLGMVAMLGVVFNWPKIWDSPPADPRKKVVMNNAMLQSAALYSQASRQAPQYM